MFTEICNAFPTNPSPGQMILRLSGVFNASHVRLEGTDLRPNLWGSYFFALAEVYVGRSADLTLGKWIVDKPAWEKVCAG